MSFLDRFAKGVKEAVDKASEAVSEAVDEGKDAVERMSRINKFKAEIRDIEKEVETLKAQIQAVKVQLGEKAMDMLRNGSLVDPELQGFMTQVEGYEQEIGAHQTAITEKEAAIETIKAEVEAEKEAEKQARAAKAEVEAKAPESAGAVCPQCGQPVPEGAAFCANCGAKIA